MKNILIISTTLKNNYALAKQLKTLLKELKVNPTLISLENYILPLYTDNIFDKKKKEYENTVESLTKLFINNDGLIICGPEYNGSTPPILNNAIAWISTSTNYWRDAFNKKIALIGTSSGGAGTKFVMTIKMQLEHLGCVVMPRAISSNDSKPLNIESTKKILNQFIELI